MGWLVTVVLSCYDVVSHPSFLSWCFAVTVALMITACLFAIYGALSRFHNGRFPVVGVEPGILGIVRATWNSVDHGDVAIANGYRKFNKLGQVFRVPSLMDSFSPVHVIPTPLITEYANADEERISFRYGLERLDLTPYTLLSIKTTANPIHLRCLRDTFSSGREVPFLADEIVASFSIEWGSSLEWKTLPSLYSSLLAIVTRNVNRVYVGLPHCRDNEMLRAIIEYTPEVVRCRTILRLTPPFLRPLVACYVLRPNKAKRTKIMNILSNTITSEMGRVSSKSQIIKPGTEGEFVTLLQALIRSAQNNHDRATEFTPKMLVTRLLMINFVGNRTTSVAMTHALWSLIDAEAAGKGYWKVLRAEIEEVLKEAQDSDPESAKTYAQEHGIRWATWSRLHTSKLVHLESFLKESMRVNTDTNLESKRMVVDPKGYTFANGTHLEPGTVTVAPIWELHHDESVYSDPNEFDAWRFLHLQQSRKIEAAGVAPNGELSKILGLATTNEHYLPFGFGKHACPGRFMATQQLKLVLSFMILNYEIRPQARPKDEWYGSSHMPNMEAGIEIRRLSPPSKT